jgi:hypothetical protein
VKEAPPAEVASAWLGAMRRGDWAEAWRQTDRIELPRRERQARGPYVRQPHHLCWDGTPLEGRSVLVRCEHGLGDTVQFLRFVPRLVRGARAVHLMIQPTLLPLFAGAPELGTVHDGWTAWWPPPEHDVEIEIMELAYAARATIADLPPPYPHLAARVAGQLPVAVPRDGLLNVGLLWAASEWDGSRSIALETLAPLLRTEGARFFSLQQGTAGRDARLEPLGIVPLARHTGEIVAAAAALLHLDLVICVDNMLAHLAGTLGRPTWLLLKHEADWRWMDGRADSPWYPGMRLFRQPAPGDWASVVAAVREALREFVPD